MGDEERDERTKVANIITFLQAYTNTRVTHCDQSTCSIALFAMMTTFYLWVRSLRNESSWWIGGLAGIAYVYMVAAWGGYVFVLNMVGVHCACLIGLGRFSSKLHMSFSLFYIIGTLGAIQVPVVGLTPLKSLEQLGSLAVFVGIQVIAFAEHTIRRKGLFTFQEKMAARAKLYAIALGVSFFLILCAPQGYFGPLSSRIRGLFVKHTRTGNPLVDSVAEHQPASSQAYYQYLNVLTSIAPVGWFLCFYKITDAKLFLTIYGAVAYFFSAKMVRLIILLGPVASSCGGWAIGLALQWAIEQLLSAVSGEMEGAHKGAKDDDPSGAAVSNSNGSNSNGSSKKNKKNSSKKVGDKKPSSASASAFAVPDEIMIPAKKIYRSEQGQLLRKVLAVVILIITYVQGGAFKDYCYKMSEALSNPSIMFKAQLRTGETIIIDDYREAYFWLRDNTPEDARVMAWWDYGYQITGIANRTTIADGNTWNHEHIALLGKCMTGPEKESHRILRHLADYVLIWAGGGGDDLAKSPHMARIANSVYRDVCPGDPTCRSFGFIDKYGTPSPKMGESLLYKLHGHNAKQGVKADPNRFKEVFSSKYGKVRIFKVLGVSAESKEWVANPENRVCDCPTCWYCKGQYPPALRTVLSKKKDFAQLEDFNAKKDKEDAEAYQKAYHENMQDPNKAAAKAKARREMELAREANMKAAVSGENEDVEDYEKDFVEVEEDEPRKVEFTPEMREKMRVDVGKDWADNDYTSNMWQLIKDNNQENLLQLLQHEPAAAYVRSQDGRGPMFWAHEYEREAIIQILKAYGVREDDRDSNGKTPLDM